MCLALLETARLATARLATARLATARLETARLATVMKRSRLIASVCARTQLRDLRYRGRDEEEGTV
eukprot:617916-Pleurochrysis_carterae.AAC.2